MPTPPDDLVEMVRQGRTAAYGRLYRRHRAVAYRQAWRFARNPADVDDLVATAFIRVLEVLSRGGGPADDRGFRPYLLTTLRHTGYEVSRRSREVELVADIGTGVVEATGRADPAVARLDRGWAVTAFATLPPRWQAVLWHTEVEGLSPTEVAPQMGLSTKGVAALAFRAREGLRQAFLQQHLAETGEGACRAAVSRLGAWVRGGLRARAGAMVHRHLAACTRCRGLAAELVDVARSLARTTA